VASFDLTGQPSVWMEDHPANNTSKISRVMRSI
jgi:hypothetical protein